MSRWWRKSAGGSFGGGKLVLANLGEANLGLSAAGLKLCGGRVNLKGDGLSAAGRILAVNL